MKRTLLTGAGWIATPQPPGPDQELYRIERPAADSLLIEGETIRWLGRADDYRSSESVTRVDLNGLGLTPGLIDFHAHPVFAATRAEEFEMRTRGADYAEIAAAGGGILNSARQMSQTGERELVERTLPFLDSALAHGTTTLEAKSGYGLAPEPEYRMLLAIRDLDRRHPLDLAPTFLGAHEYPEPFRDDHEGYLRLLIDEMIPHVAGEKLAVACDVYCESGVFSLSEARRVLEAARDHGLALKLHTDQFSPLGGAKLAAELGALSADHIEFIDEEGIEALASSGVLAGLLPVAAHFLRMEKDPPVRRMIDRGIACALATDFNPGSAMSENMQMAIHLAVIRFRITAGEALWMSTAGSARALGLFDRGWIGEGALADLVAWDADDPAQLPYHFGVNLAAMVFKRGRLVAERGRLMG